MKKLLLFAILAITLSANQTLTESRYADNILKIWAQGQTSKGEAIMTFMVNPKTGFIDRWITYKKTSNRDFVSNVKKFLDKIANTQVGSPTNSSTPVLVHVILTGQNNS